jgi:membrane-bound lytic murein transglycosylase B
VGAADPPDASAEVKKAPPADPKKPAKPTFDAKVPATWKLSAKLAKGSDARAALVKDLSAPATAPGEAPLTAEEAEALLDDPRAELVYADKTISIVAPSMIQRQRKDHLDLLAAFLKPERLEAGAAFAREHQVLLEKLEKSHEVDRYVVVSILMWESRLGTITGDFVAFNAFTSQAYFTEEASAFAMAQKEEKKLIDDKKQAERVGVIRERARKNLLALLRQCKSKGIDSLTVKGSWAGALGYPQFMPASLQWAEDGDGDGKIDLFTFDDSMASIARYLAAHGYAKSASKAVWDYNHEEAYVKGVLAFAAALKEQLAKGPPDAGAPEKKSAPDASVREARDAGVHP